MSSTANQPDGTSEIQEAGSSIEQQHQQEEGQQPQEPSIEPTTQAAEIDPDLSADTHRHFAEARSTPILIFQLFSSVVLNVLFFARK
ncbi:hypothetical protein [Parasitella parasitica]|uniref:Uncharacterized protein n=1 Tax=Parasitella parasitica TaxID=35722 RepID=A0A0B7NEC6_9FUNG|nr:hypothetical protein [Parasitella parasitica]